MNLSLGELQALCLKAARGAGYSWGLAEEVGRAVCWLEARDLSGATALAHLLEAGGHSDPVKDGRDWRATGGLLCPIKLGAAISDFAHALDASGWRAHAVAEPLLVVPFTASCGARIEWDSVQSLDTRHTETLRIWPGSIDIPATRQRAMISGYIYARLDAFAQETYAPATDASRLAGAGAGLTDND